MQTTRIDCLDCDAKVTVEVIYGGDLRFCPSCGSKRIVTGKGNETPTPKFVPDTAESHTEKEPVMNDETPTTPEVESDSKIASVLSIQLDCYGRDDLAGCAIPCDPIIGADVNFRYEVKDAPEQGTLPWLAWRKQGITATEAASIMFPDSHSSPMTVYSEKIGLTTHDQSDPEGYMEWGHRIEDLLVGKFMEMHPNFRRATHGRLYQRDWCKCSLDAQCFDDDGNPVIIECKTGQNEAKWNPIPDRYYAQVQWQMMVTGIRKAYFSVLIRGHQWFEKEVDYNPAFVKQMVDKCFYVWDCIQNKTAPARLGINAADKEAIAAMAGESGHTGSPEEVDEDTVATYARLQEAYKKAEEEFTAFKNTLGFKMVDASKLLFKGRTFATWVERKGAVSVDKVMLQNKYPEIYKECLKQGMPTRYVKYMV